MFGQVYNQWKNKECVCPNCNRSIAASRFAPHLEKCLGMGRNSSRIANRRYAPGGPPGRRSLTLMHSYPQAAITRRACRGLLFCAALCAFIVLKTRGYSQLSAQGTEYHRSSMTRPRQPMVLSKRRALLLYHFLTVLLPQQQPNQRSAYDKCSALL